MTGHNGCDTRNDILRADLQRTCSSPARTTAWSSAASSPTRTPAATIPFVRGPESADVQIDHVVALSDAWQKGAQQ